VNIGTDSPVPIGDLISFNLTPGGPLKDWTDGEIMRVLRQGVDRDGRRLFAMASLPVRNFSDDDIQAVIAYLRSSGAAQPAPPGRLPQPAAGRVCGRQPVPPAPAPVTGSISAPPKGPTAEFGAYVLSYNDCSFCHGDDYTGGTPGGLEPVGPSLRLVLAGRASSSSPPCARASTGGARAQFGDAVEGLRQARRRRVGRGVRIPAQPAAGDGQSVAT
jgi:cytochrome c553